MKPNELVLTILQIAAPVYAFSVGLVWQGWFLVCWIVFFGIVELTAKKVSGKTLSQHVWGRPFKQRLILSLIMIAGMVALGWHFLWG